MTINWSDFEKIDMRLGTIISVEDFPKAKKPAYKLTIDFGDKIGNFTKTGKKYKQRNEDWITCLTPQHIIIHL